ncbi:MAG: lipopolysaccharide kinase InaA family protein [Cellvibrionaceae bacterium]
MNNYANDDHILLYVLSKQGQWQKLGKPRKRKMCLCENYELEDRFIIKQFTFQNKDRPHINWWQLEDSILSILDGALGSPKTHGFLEENNGSKRIVFLVKDKIKGNTLEELKQTLLTEKQSAETGQLLAKLHNRNIVTRDCHLENLLLTTSNTLSFIDFGKARAYSHKNILFFFQAGWDCWKAMWRCNKLDKKLCEIMMDNYWNTIETTVYSKFMYTFMQKFSGAHQRLRLLKQKLTKK